jgi:hypothetical protein
VAPRDRVFAALLDPVVQEFSALERSRHSPPRFTLPHSSLCPAQVLPCYMLGVLPSGPLIFPIPLARETHSLDVPGVATRRPKGRRTDVPDPEKIQQDRRCTAASRAFSSPLISPARCASVHPCLLANLHLERHDTVKGAASALEFQSVIQPPSRCLSHAHPRGLPAACHGTAGPGSRFRRLEPVNQPTRRHHAAVSCGFAIGQMHSTGMVDCHPCCNHGSVLGFPILPVCSVLCVIAAIRLSAGGSRQ